MMSPGSTCDSGTRGRVAYWPEAECAMETPACAHAHDVSPEQSKELGPAAPKTYGAPRTLRAAATAMAAALEFAGGTKPEPSPPPPVPGEVVGACTGAVACAAAAIACSWSRSAC